MNYSHKKLILIGFADAMNGFMIVYSTAYVSPSLQPILLNSNIPVILLLSKLILKKSYSLKQQFGALLVFLGIILALIPSIKNDSFDSQGAWYYTLIFSLACVPAMLLNVVQEWVYDMPYYNVTYLVAWDCFYQLLFLIFFFGLI